MMTDFIKIFLTLIFFSVSTLADEYLGTPNSMWPIIKSTISEQHKEKISQQDSSAYLMPDSGALENSVLFGYQDLVEKFVNDKYLLQKEGGDSLYLAASLGRTAAIKTLICNGVDVDSKYTNSLTPLFAAAEYGELEAFKLLLDKGANINHRANVPFTILQLAIVEKRKEIIEYLLDSEYIITTKDEHLLKDKLIK